MPGKQTNSVKQVINRFSKKFTRANANSPENLEQVNPVSQLHNAQEKIQEYEDLRIQSIKKQFTDFMTPITQEIEQDEQNLVKAYNLYCQLQELNSTAGDSLTHLRDFSLTSPLCKKVEYTSGDLFLYLKIWFLIVTPDAKYVPELTYITTAAGTSCVLTFEEKEMWHPSIAEKEIMQVVQERD